MLRSCLIGAMLLVVLVACGSGQTTSAPAATQPAAPVTTPSAPAQPNDSASTMTLSSSAFTDGQAIPSTYAACGGGNQSPPLQWSNVPTDARSLALLMDDPDAPGGSFTHWIAYNIPTDLTEFPAGSGNQAVGLDGAQYGTNGDRGVGYTGPCPPSGEHRYVLTLYALDTTLTLERPDKQRFEAAIKDHILAQAQLSATYSRR